MSQLREPRWVEDSVLSWGHWPVRLSAPWLAPHSMAMSRARRQLNLPAKLVDAAHLEMLTTNDEHGGLIVGPPTHAGGA